LIGQELPVQGHDNTITSRVGHPLDVEPEVDGAHDAIAALFVDELLERRLIDLQHLVEPNAVEGLDIEAELDRVVAPLLPDTAG
jgi:hypothetical protein